MLCFSVAYHVVTTERAEEELQDLLVSLSLSIRLDGVPKSSEQLQVNFLVDEVGFGLGHELQEPRERLVRVLPNVLFAVTPPTLYGVGFKVVLRTEHDLDCTEEQVFRAC
ncbi:unnamed protein product [Didymodactylos carnosus]|uniref:Uncharacterized protein n=1 Tax=Didymodactylos carnosus TaxID=1234261 RepID=A0A815Y1T9_9BILA|nr:unnamed protein product [Didymodactylos carnosus]CAF4426612.1 unnamed protein product [Didymodactylos carnosus]